MNLPRDDNRIALQLAPATIALERTVDADVSASTEITLNAATTFIRVYAIAKDVYFKWGTDDVSASNFDAVIPAGQIVDFSRPKDINGIYYTAVNLIEREAGATVIVLEY